MTVLGFPNKKRLPVLLCLVYEVVNRFHGFTTDLMPATLVESMVERIALPPFSGLKRGIPAITQLSYHGRRMRQGCGHDFRLLLGQRPQFFVSSQLSVIDAFTHERTIAPHTRLVGIESGHNAGQGGSANRRGRIPALIHETLAPQMIEVGRFQVGGCPMKP